MKRLLHFLWCFVLSLTCIAVLNACDNKKTQKYNDFDEDEELVEDEFDEDNEDDEEIDIFLPACLLKLSDDGAALHLRDGQDHAALRRFLCFGKIDARKAKDLLSLLLFVIVDERDEFDLVLHDARKLAAVIASAKEIKSPLLADILIDMIEFMPGMFPFHVVPFLPDAGFLRIPEYALDGHHSFPDRFALHAA